VSIIPPLAPDGRALSPRAQRIARAVRTELHAELGAAVERLLAEHPDEPAMFVRSLGLRQAQRIVAPLSDVDEAQCEVCGCTENDPCEGGCAWVTGGMSDLCSACVVPARREAAECAVLGCGSQSSYLGFLESRIGWTEVRQNWSGTDSRWYHSAQCAATALTAGSAVRPGKVTPAGGAITQAAAGTEPLQLVWDGKVVVSAVPHGDGAEARVSCTTPDGGRAVLVLGQEQRLALAGLLDIETVRDINRRCGTPGCGTPVIGTDSPDHPRWWGWAQVRVKGVGVGLRWLCSPPCVFDAIARAGLELADAVEADELQEERAGDGVYGLDEGPGW
jgi:hypothetical protein